VISPQNVNTEAKKRKNENLRFRSFLKGHADVDELDRHFWELHQKLFSGYDCCKCGNCCRAYSTTLSDAEITAIAKYLSLERQEFITRFQHRRVGTPGSLPLSWHRWKMPDPGLQANGLQRVPLHGQAGALVEPVQHPFRSGGVPSGL